MVLDELLQPVRKRKGGGSESPARRTQVGNGISKRLLERQGGVPRGDGQPQLGPVRRVRFNSHLQRREWSTHLQINKAG